MGYREKWFQANPSPARLWICSKCHGLFLKDQIEIDHILPVRKGGTDDLWNLQSMCWTCNRKKGKNQSKIETATTVLSAVTNGEAGKLVTSIAKQTLKDILGIKYKR